MGILKVCVYAIAKNEEKFAERWAKSMSEADGIYVLDTGSDDRTVKLLEENGVSVTSKEVFPWRFDSARNESLALVPDDADICVCTDLDEVFHPGWRKAMEKAWINGATRLRYRYTWNFLSDGSEGTVFYIEKSHARHGYFWTHPVHETLSFSGKEVILTAEGVQLDHHADETKSRGQYLPLLELAVKEDPENDRNMHYLGREYMFCRRYDDAIVTLKKHLALKTAVWRDERCASMRFLAKCLTAKDDLTEAYKYHLLAIAEAPHLREPWLDAANFEYRRENWFGTVYFTEYALDIKERPRTYITEAGAWGAFPYDILSIAYYRLGDLTKAIENVRKAISFSGEQRLKDNLEIMLEADKTGSR